MEDITGLYTEAQTKAAVESLAFDEMDSGEHSIAENYLSRFDWIWKYEGFLTWRSQSSSVFWISGKPGSGKSTILRYVLNGIKDQEELENPSIVAGFFFSGRGEKFVRTFQGFLQAILSQILSQLPSLRHHSASKYMEQLDMHGSGFHWPISTLRGCIISILEDDNLKSMIYIFIDALDECQGSKSLNDPLNTRNEMLEFLETICQSCNGKLKIFITSREEESINVAMEKIKELKSLRYSSIKLHEHTRNDMEKYIAREITKLQDICRERVKKHLLSHAQGVFLWVRLVVEDLVDSVPDSSDAEIEEALEKMPKELDDLYSRLLAKLEGDPLETEAMLRWTLPAETPLTLEEFQHAIAFTMSDPYTKVPSLEELENSETFVELDQIESHIREFTGGLLEVVEHGEVGEDSKSKFVHIIHRSARDFLARKPRIAGNIGSHRGYYGDFLHDAAYRGTLEMVQLLLEKGADVNAEGGYFGNALQGAIAGRSAPDIAQLLIQNGADVDAHGRQFGNALQAAVTYENIELTQLLVQKGVDVNAQGGNFSTALQAAAEAGRGSLEIVQMLIQNGADVNAQGGVYGNTLQAAAFRGNLEIVYLLIQNGVDVNAQGGQFGTALQAAATGSLEMVQLLIENEADVNAQGGHFGTALQAAASYENLEIVQLLIQKGADVNAQGGKYGTALQAAVHKDNLEIVQLLIQKGAHMNAQGGEYGNALQAAAYAGISEIVQLLTQKGADVNTYGDRYGNALQAAAAGRGTLEVVEFLIQNGIDVNAQGGEYGNALQAAAYRGKLEIVHMLIQKKAEVNAQGGKYGTALQAAIYRGKHEIVQLLIQNGADVNAQGGKYGNALQVGSTKSLEVVELLIKNGANVNAQGGEYGNALQAAVYYGKLEIVKFLIQNGADVNAQGGEYGNALQAACAEGGGGSVIVELLLQHGAKSVLPIGRVGLHSSILLEKARAVGGDDLDMP